MLQIITHTHTITHTQVFILLLSKKSTSLFRLTLLFQGNYNNLSFPLFLDADVTAYIDIANSSSTAHKHGQDIETPVVQKILSAIF